MRTLGRQAARRARPHFSPACPFRGRGRRGKLALVGPAPPAHSVAPDVDVPAFRAPQVPQVQLVWNQHSRQQTRPRPHVGKGGGGSSDDGAPERVLQLHDAAAAAPSHLDQASAVELMRRVKAARSWQQLQSIVDGNLRSMNHMHVSAVVTHMAQLHASSSNDNSSSCSVDSSSKRGRYGARSGNTTTSGISFDDLRTDGALDELLQHLDGDSTLHARQSGFSRGASTGVPLQAADPHSQTQPHHVPLHSSMYATGVRLLPWEHPHPPQAGALPRPLFPPLSPPPHDDARGLFLQQLEQAVAARLPDFEGRQLANTLWAVAKLGHRPSERWLELLLTRAGDQMQTFSPQHLANTLYALMLLRYMPPPVWLDGFYAAASRRLHGFGPGELSHMCYAAGKLGLRPGRELLGGVLHHSMMHMHKYDVRELALLLYGVVHMGASLHADWLRVYRKRVMGLVVESGALPGQLLERLARQGAQPDLAELARAQLAERQRHQQQQGGQQQPQLERQEQLQQRHHVQALDHHPSPERGQGNQPQQHALEARRGGPRRVVEGHRATPSRGSPDGVAASSRVGWVASYLPTVLCSLAEIGYRPPAAFMSTILAAVGSCAGQLTPVGLTTVLLSLANMRYRPHPTLFQRVWDLLINSLDSLDTQQSTIALWACATLGCDAPRRDVHAILMNAAARLPEHSDGEILQLLEAVSALEFKPRTSWLELLESDLYNRLPRMQPREVAALLLPLAVLRHRPHRLWMARWAGVLQAALPGLGLSCLAAAVYGAARLGFRPPSRLCAELLAATAAGMAAAVDGTAELGTATTVLATAQQQHPHLQPRQQQRETQLQHESWRPEPGEEPEEARQRRARPAWARRLGDRSGGRLPETLSRLLWAVAVLDIRPGEGWLAGYMACIRLVAGELSVQERSQVLWALARLRHDPGPEWAEVLALWRIQRQQQRAEHAAAAGKSGTAQPTAAAAASADTAAAAVVIPSEVVPGSHLREPSSNSNSSSNTKALSVDGTAAHAQGLSRGSLAGVAAGALEDGQGGAADGGAVAGSAGASALAHRADSNNGNESGSSNGADVGVDLNTLVLQGIREWAARQLGDPTPAATPTRRRAVARGH